MVLLSPASKSNWYVFQPGGPKPDLYKTLPVVFAGSRHSVTTERIVREKQPVSDPSGTAGADSTFRKSKGTFKDADGMHNVVNDKTLNVIRERKGSAAPTIKVRCEGGEKVVDGVLKYDDEKFVILHKGLRYSIKKFAALVGVSAGSKRIKILATGETLETYLENHGQQSMASSRRESSSARSSISGAGDSSSMHFFEEKTPG